MSRTSPASHGRDLRVSWSAAETERDTLIVVNSLADEIAFKLERQILAGELAPGQKLYQQELCDRFDVSRTPIREAFHKLHALGLIELLPNRGARVRVPTRRELEEVFDLRAELEAYATELACKLAGHDLDAALNRSIDRVREMSNSVDEQFADDPGLNARMSGAIRDFHQTIQKAAGNQRLIEIVGHLERAYLGDFCCHVLMKPATRESLHINEHVGIRDAIVSRNGPAAKELMRAHIRHAKDALLQYLDDRDFWNRTKKTKAGRKKRDGAG